MRILRLCLTVACLLVSEWPATAADQQPAGRVEHVPPEEALGILGSPVVAPDGKTIGRLVDVLVDASGAPQAGVIDVGGFMGVGARTIAVHWSVLHFAPANPKQPITLDLTLDQIKAAPEYGNPTKPAPVVLPTKAPGETISGTTGSPTSNSGATLGGSTGNAATGSGTTGGAPTTGVTTGSGSAGSGPAGGATGGGATAGGGASSSGGGGSTGSSATGSASEGSGASGGASAGNVPPAGGTAVTGTTAGNGTGSQTTPPRSQ
jgi:PRC-barrel domain